VTLQVLGLPGRDEATEAWLRVLLDALELDDAACRVQHYRFWDTLQPVDIDAEAARAGGDGAECVVAKSLGTLIALTAWRGHGLRPRRSVFIGTPIAHYQAEQHSMLRDYCGANAVLFVQQTDDFTGSFGVVAAAAAALPDCRAFEVPGSDHRYDEIAACRDAIAGWLSGARG
jgi:hypothetical protein